MPGVKPEKCLIPVSARGGRERGCWAETCMIERFYRSASANAAEESVWPLFE